MNLYRFPISGHPYADESLMGFALRMASANRLNGLYGLAPLFNADRLFHLSIRHAPLIIWLFDAPPCSLDRNTATLQTVCGKSVWQIYGHVVMRPYLLRLRRPQLCPRCLGELGYVRTMWDFTFACCCPNHELLLIERCPQCGKSISWHRKHLFFCSCGQDFRRCTASRASPQSIQISQWLQHILGVQQNAPSLALPADSPLQTMTHLSLDGVMRILWATGIRLNTCDVLSPGYSGRFLSTLAASACVERSLQRLTRFSSPLEAKQARKSFVLKALVDLSDDAVLDNDRIFARTILTIGKRNRCGKASIERLNPLAQMSLF
jgi:hypothetical protein